MDSPRLIRPAGPGLATYVRAGWNDHRPLLQLLARGSSLAGVVLDPCLDGRHEELRKEARARNVETVLDSRAVELATAVGFDRRGVSSLPWAAEAPDTPVSLKASDADDFVGRLAEHIVTRDFSSALAPTHYLKDADDSWLAVDRTLTVALRDRLDSLGRHDVPIYYPLVLHATAFRDARQRSRLRAALEGLPIDALWFRIHPFGSNAGPSALRGYIEACNDFHSLGVPLVAERTGTIGIALLAFGAVGGIEGGVTFGERFDVGPLLRPPKSSKPFLPATRVYLAPIGAYLTKKQAESFFTNRQMKGSFGCVDSGCCPRGTVDMLRDPAHHFLTQRLGEVGRLSSAPNGLRPQLYMDDFLRPATDLALRAAKVEPALNTHRARLEGWRHALGGITRAGRVTSFSAVPEGQRIRRRLGA